MKREICLGTLMALLIAVAFPASAVAAGPKQRCYKDWSQAKAVVRKNKLTHVDKLSQAALQAGLGQIMKVRLCKKNGGFEYRLILRDRLGRLRRWVTGARRPFRKPPRTRRFRRKR